MPFVNGLTVVNALREIFPTLPVVVFTAFANPEIRAACLEQGAAAFLEKPLDSQELIAAVQRALRIEPMTERVSPPSTDKPSGAAWPNKSKKRMA